MKRIYHPYWKWECFNNGMWSKPKQEEKIHKLEMAIDFTSDHNKYGNAMLDVILLWKHSMENFLTNTSVNHRAHIGHCACSYRLGIEESIVRQAWKHLTDTQRNLANLQAEQAKQKWIKQYAKTNSKLCNRVGAELLF